MSALVPVSTLSNGVRLIIQPSDRPITSLAILVTAGSTYERANEYGAAHFVEHLCMRESEGYPEEAMRIATTYGGTEANAMTSHDETIYHATGPAVYARVFMGALFDGVRRPVLDDNILTERGAILSELQERQDSAMFRARSRAQKKMFRGGYAREIGGSCSEVVKLKPTDLKAFHTRNYVGSNIIVSVSGAMTPQLRRWIRTQALKFPKGKATKPTNGETRWAVAASTTTVTDAVQMTSVQLVYSMSHLRTPKQLATMNVLSDLLGSMPKGKLFTELRDKHGLVYDVHGHQLMHRFVSGFMISYKTEASKAKEVRLILSNLLDKRDVTLFDVEHSKATVKGSLLWQSDDLVASSVSTGVTAAHYGYVISDSAAYRIIDEVTVDDVRKMWDQLFWGNTPHCVQVVPK